MEPITAAEMRALEQEAIASGRVTGLELMERAGQGVVEAIFEEWPELAHGTRCAFVLCGPGNNGGDGFVVARLLRARGWTVEALLYGNPETLPPDAKINFERCDCPTIVRAVDPPPLMDDSFHSDARPDIIVDAFFGIGLNRPVRGIAGAFTAMQDLLRDKGVRTVALDIPSGLCADTGEPIGQAFKADLTVTFYAPKHGHLRALGPEYCGKLIVKDIGL